MKSQKLRKVSGTLVPANKIRMKKAVSHIEMIISFSIFLLFLIFLFSFLNPIKQPDTSPSLLRVVERGIESYSTTLLEIPVALTAEKDDCFKIENPFGTASSEKIFVKDKSKKDVRFNTVLSDVVIEGTGEKFYYLYSLLAYPLDLEFDSHMISTCPDDTETLASSEYDFSIPRLRTIYLKSTLDDTASKYENEADYNSLKESLDFPISSDFAIFISNSDTKEEILSMSVTKPEKVVVHAKEIPIIIIEEEASGEKQEIKASMNIQVW